MSESAWRPDQVPAMIFMEEAWLQGALLTCIAYGAVAALCIQCFTKLTPQLKRPNPLRNSSLLVYVGLVFALSTIFIGAAMRFTQEAFVYGCNLLSGSQFDEADDVKCSRTVGTLANATLIISILLSDAMPLWRCVILYRNSTVPNWASILVTSLIWLAEFILGVIFLSQGSPTTIFGITDTDIADFTLGFWCLSLAVNILSAVAVITRLLVYRSHFKDNSAKQRIRQYTGINAMAVESGLLYIVFLIIFIGTRAKNSSLMYTFVQPLSLVHAVSTLVIVYRIAEGKAWMEDTYKQLVRGEVDQPGSHFSTFQAAEPSGFDNEA